MRCICVALALICACPVLTIGQEKKEDDGPVGIFDSRDEYSQFMGSAKRTAWGEGGSPELQAMIPLLNDIALNRPVGSTSQQFSGGASLMGLIGNPRVREDLEIVDEQYEQFRERAAEAQREAAEQGELAKPDEVPQAGERRQSVALIQDDGLEGGQVGG